MGENKIGRSEVMRKITDSKGSYWIRDKKEDKMKGSRCFWMLYVEGKESPRHKHFTLPEAEVEAERLARLTGKRVFALEAFAFVEIEKVMPPVVWNKTTDKGE